MKDWIKLLSLSIKPIGKDTRALSEFDSKSKGLDLMNSFEKAIKVLPLS